MQRRARRRVAVPLGDEVRVVVVTDPGCGRVGGMAWQATGRCPPTDPPLDGLRVLELGSFIAGPFAGQLLGDLGADVVKVEPPETGDPMRRWGVLDDGRSLWWPAIARNKRSVAVDLRDERGRDVVRRLAAHVRRRARELQAGHARAVGPRLRRARRGEPGGRARARVRLRPDRARGPTSPASARSARRWAAIRHTTGEPDRPPARTGHLARRLAGRAVRGDRHADRAARAAAGAGRGQEVDVAISEAVFALMESTVADFELGGVVRTRNGGVLNGVAPSNAYPTADGRDVVIAANADAVFARLVRRDGPARARDRPALRRARGARRAPGRARRRDRGVDARHCRRRPARAPRAALGARPG